MIKLIVDEREIEVEEGKTLLLTCLENGVYVPNLCCLEEMKNPPASCRLCFVEIEGENKPIVSCRVEPREGMVVRTDAAAVRQFQRTALRLLLSTHRVACRNCPSNRKCVLQNMAKFLSIPLKSGPLDYIERTSSGFTHPFLDYDPLRCVLCGRCVFTCREKNGYSLLTFAGRGFDTVVSFVGERDPARHSCDNCRACAESCPVSAIFIKDAQGGF
ncbi:MAG: 2Fe-2S iron-sulfur cluster-binding protein [Syntrophales bacterium]|nr:2Fe-2S iron-sulfur cluster-binding protein [Syntrophales bacterium]